MWVQDRSPCLIPKMTGHTKINIQGLIQRDRCEINKLVDTYSDRIYHVCMSYVFNESDAQELTQDVFMACIKTIESFKGNSSIYTWLHRIAINKSLDFIKYKKRQKRMSYLLPLVKDKDNAYAFEPIECSHPGIQLESQEQMSALYQAIHSLPDRQKTALILMKIEGRSQVEAGEIMGINAKAIESLVQRGKSNLRKKLSDIYDNFSR